jgi:hypothetical protein
VKVLLAAALAVSTLAGAAVAVPAEAAVKVVIKPGYHYSYGGRHYRNRAYKCVWKYHRKVCKYRYW